MRRQLVSSLAVLFVLMVATVALAFPIITATGGFPVLPLGTPLAGDTITTTYESASMEVSFTPLPGGQVVGQGTFTEFSQFDDGNSRCDWRATFTLFIVGEFDGMSMMTGTFGQQKSVEILPGCEVEGVDTELEAGDTTWTALVDMETGTIAQSTGFPVPWEVSFDPAEVFPFSSDEAAVTVDFSFDLSSTVEAATADGFSVEVLANEGSLFLDTDGAVLDGFARVRIRFEDADGFMFVSESSYVFRGDGMVDHITSTTFDQDGEILGVDVTQHPRNPFTVDLGAGTGSAVVDGAGTEFALLFDPVDLPEPTTTTTESAEIVDEDIVEVFPGTDEAVPQPGNDQEGGSKIGLFAFVGLVVAGLGYGANRWLRGKRSADSDDAAGDITEVEIGDSARPKKLSAGDGADRLEGLRDRIAVSEVAGDEQRAALVQEITAIGKAIPEGVHNLHLRGLVGAVTSGEGVAAIESLDHAIEALRRSDEAAKDSGEFDPADVERYLDDGRDPAPPPESGDSDIEEVILGGPAGRRRKRPAPPKTRTKSSKEHEPKPRLKRGGPPGMSTVPREGDHHPRVPGSEGDDGDGDDGAYRETPVHHCDWEFVFSGSQGTEVLRQGSGHICCRYVLEIKATGILDELYTQGRQLPASEAEEDRFRIPAYSFQPRGLGFETSLAVRTGEEGTLDWMQGLGDQASSVPARKGRIQQHPFEEPPDLLAFNLYAERTEIVVRLESGCPTHENVYKASGDSRLDYSLGHECTNTAGEPVCPVELETYLVAYGDVSGGLSHSIGLADPISEVPDYVQQVEDEDGTPQTMVSFASHEHPDRQRASLASGDTATSAKTLTQDVLKLTVYDKTKQSDAMIVPADVFPTTDRVSAANAASFQHQFSVKGKMTAPCTPKNTGGVGLGPAPAAPAKCCGHGECRCDPEFELSIGEDATLTVDGQSFRLERVFGRLKKGDVAYWTLGTWTP